MALGDLLFAIEQDAATQAAAIRDAARAKSAELEAQAERVRAERYTALQRDCTVRAQIEADAALADAQRTARAATLAARAAMLERIDAALRAKLRELSATVEPALLRAAIACAGERAGVLHCAASRADDARAQAPATLRVEERADVSGVVISLASGIEIVATLDALLDREWPELAARAIRLVDEEAKR